MYLIARPKSESDILKDLLIQYNIESEYLPVMEIVPNQIDWQDVFFQINEDDVLFFVSPTAIKLSIPFLKNLSHNVKVIVPGLSSKKIILQYNQLLNVFMPLQTSGIDAIIEENLFISAHRIVIFGGGEINQKLLIYSNQLHIPIKLIDLYKRVNVVESRIEESCNKIICNEIDAIIVTSTIVAKWLKSLILDKRIHLLISSMVFISTHPQITSILQSYGVSVIETEHSSNESILDLIRKLNHDR